MTTGRVRCVHLVARVAGVFYGNIRAFVNTVGEEERAKQLTHIQLFLSFSEFDLSENWILDCSSLPASI